MTPTRRMILRAIRENDRHTIEDISRYIGMSETYTLSVVQNMVEEGQLEEREVQ